VRYQRLTRLLDELALARVDGKATRLLAQLARMARSNETLRFDT